MSSLQRHRKRHRLKHPPERKPPGPKPHQLATSLIQRNKKRVIFPAIYPVCQYAVEGHGFGGMPTGDEYLGLVSGREEEFGDPVDIVAYATAAGKLRRIFGRQERNSHVFTSIASYVRGFHEKASTAGTDFAVAPISTEIKKEAMLAGAGALLVKRRRLQGSGAMSLAQKWNCPGRQPGARTPHEAAFENPVMKIDCLMGTYGRHSARLRGSCLFPTAIGDFAGDPAHLQSTPRSTQL